MKRLSVNQEVESSEDEVTRFSDEDGTYIDDIYIPPPILPTCSFDSKGPRLVITKIVNEFFKSYAQNTVLGPFSKCFNAIVGPNGSGKSNVIDSMLFVFGYRATKIRSKKVSVLLHNSENHRNVQSATVEVHFALIIDKPGDDYDIIPNSEFVVARIANKDNSSYYQLNGKKVQFKEVALLLRKYGIDLDHNRFLILQGEVEQIAMMKCKGDGNGESGMLEYLEDIIGTTRYQKPLLQLNDRVEQLTDIRSEKANRLKLVKKELEELQPLVAEASDFLKAENTATTYKNSLYQKNIFNLERKVVDKEKDKESVVEKCQTLLEKLEELGTLKQEKEATLQKDSEKYNQITKKKDQVKDAFAQANNKDVQLQAEMLQTNKSRKKTIELLAEEKKKLSQFQKTPEESAKGIEECERKEEGLIAKKEKLEKEKSVLLANLRTETAELQEKKEELETDLVVLKRAVDQTKSAFTLAESELKICISNEENERSKLEELKNLYSSNENLMRERMETLSVLKRKIPLTEKSLTEATNELDQVKREEAQLITEIRKQRADLEEKRSSMQASKSRSNVLDSLMRQKEEGECPGLFGRLGDLGAIDQKYDVAVSTACGPLDNIVVDTVSTAQWCIEFLKKHDIGRATFIALDKQEHLCDLANSRIQTPENVPRLFDLIRVQDDRVKTAFYYALRDTLVSNELEQASRIAYGATRYRVVTLGGDLIETTGTMSGGGKSVSRGRMGQSIAVTNVNPKDLDKMEANINTNETGIRQFREQQTALEKQINTLEPELRQMKINFEKFSIELQSLKDRQPQLKEQVKAQEMKAQQTRADPAQVKKLTKIVETKKREYDQANDTAQELQVQVDALTKEIKEKTLGKMKTMDKNINEVTKEIDKFKTEITRLKVSVKTAERNAKKSTEKIATMEQDIKSFETRLREMNANRQEIEADAEKLLKCINDYEEKLTSGDEEFAALKKEVTDLTKQENKLKSEKVDIDQQLKVVEGKVNAIKTTMHQLNVKLTQLKMQEILNETVEELKRFTEEELAEMNAENIERELRLTENKIKTMKPNLSVLQDYKKKNDIYLERMDRFNEVAKKREDMKNVYDKLRNQRKQEFLTGFEIIRMKLKEMYQMITLGGDADFELVDTFDPFTEGIQLNVRPPKKSWKKISNLSGGEKTLSSLALVFALHYYKPSPLYVMDEIDAALDFKNVSIVGHYIKERTKNAQFIIISLRSQMFELCDNLVGIYKTFNTTKSITIDPRIHDEKEDQVVPLSKNNSGAPFVLNNESTENVPYVNTQTNVDRGNAGENEDDLVSEDEPPTKKTVHENVAANEVSQEQNELSSAGNRTSEATVSDTDRSFDSVGVNSVIDDSMVLEQMQIDV